MKKIFLLFAFSVVLCSAFAQIKVISGRVGIGTTSPTYALDIYGGNIRGYYSSNYPLILEFYNADPRICSTSKVVFYKPNGGGYIDIQCKTLFEYSDSTAKENITLLGNNSDKKATTNTISSLEKIKKLQGVTYTWKNDQEKKIHAGFLAQEVEKVIPEAVMTVDSTQSKSMAYTAIIPYLVEAIKEQQTEIEELKKKLNQ